MCRVWGCCGAPAGLGGHDGGGDGNIIRCPRRCTSCGYTHKCWWFGCISDDTHRWWFGRYITDNIHHRWWFGWYTTDNIRHRWWFGRYTTDNIHHRWWFGCGGFEQLPLNVGQARP
jgi:hypothetical protein